MDSDFCTALPKIELHAHLNGSLSDRKIKELLERWPHKHIKESSVIIAKGSKRSLDECFEAFKIIHKVTDHAEVITEVTKSVIEDFAEENVHYLELRSTPRDNPATGLTKREYVDAVLRGIREHQEEGVNNIDVRFLLSIDRRQKLADASETVDLAIEYLKKAPDIVVGVDLSGDPHVGSAKEFIPLLQRARSTGLKLSLHMAEIAGLDDENYALLQIPPDRIGHGTFLDEDEKCKQDVMKKRIPLEICLTSNVKSRTVKSYDDGHHHIHRWHRLGQPFVLCTDDKGVFSTSLSSEYKIASHACGLDASDLYDLSKNSIDSIFSDESMKEKLRNRWEEWRRSNDALFQ